MNESEKILIRKKLISYLNKKVFTGCALGFSYLKDNNFINTSFFVGNTDLKEKSIAVGEKSFFDVASLTKPVVTVLSLLALKKEGKIHFKETLGSIFSDDIPYDKKNITILQLISHCSGLPSHRHYHKYLIDMEVKERKKNIIKFILNENLKTTPGKSYVYSDLDYILLGLIIEKKSREPLDQYWTRKITEPLNISNCFMFSKRYKEENKNNFIVTGKCSWTKKTLCGLVHDDNCRALGCISGHAGLFSTLKGISFLSEYLLQLHSKKVQHPSFEIDDFLFLLQQIKSTGRPCGFDIPSGKNPASGSYFSGESIGHLGFTGTSFWIDLKQKSVVVLLTNRVIYGEDNKKIKKMRPDIHNTVMSLL